MPAGASGRRTAAARNRATSCDARAARDACCTCTMARIESPHAMPSDRSNVRASDCGDAARTTIGDEELLAIVLGTGVRAHPALDVAAELVRTCRRRGRAVARIAARARAGHRRRRGACRADRRRVRARPARGRAEQHRERSASAEDVFRCVAPRLAGLAAGGVPRRSALDIRNGLLDIVEVARGTVHGVEVHPREVFRPLVRMAAAGARARPQPSVGRSDAERRGRRADAAACARSASCSASRSSITW